jgi:hypothetical protein
MSSCLFKIWQEWLKNMAIINGLYSKWVVNQIFQVQLQNFKMKIMHHETNI